MRRYGEIGRIVSKDGTYIFGVGKSTAPYFLDTPWIPSLWFSRTLRSAKKHQPKNKPSSDYGKYDLRHSIVGNTFNTKVIRKGIEIFQNYLNTVQPEYVSFGVYEGDPPDIMEKRLKLYSKVVTDCGYDFDRKYIDQLYWDAYGFKRRRDGDSR